MLFVGERRKTSSEWGVRVLWVWVVRKAWRERKEAVRRWVGDRIWEGERGTGWLVFFNIFFCFFYSGGLLCGKMAVWGWVGMERFYM